MNLEDKRMVLASDAAHQMLCQNASRIQKHKIWRRKKRKNVYGYFWYSGRTLTEPSGGTFSPLTRGLRPGLAILGRYGPALNGSRSFWTEVRDLLSIPFIAPCPASPLYLATRHWNPAQPFSLSNYNTQTIPSAPRFNKHSLHHHYLVRSQISNTIRNCQYSFQRQRNAEWTPDVRSCTRSNARSA